MIKTSLSLSLNKDSGSVYTVTLASCVGCRPRCCCPLVKRDALQSRARPPRRESQAYWCEDPTRRQSGHSSSPRPSGGQPPCYKGLGCRKRGKKR